MKNAILRKFQVSPSALLDKGMEADVYAYGPDRVLKLYIKNASIEHLWTLQQFYASLDRNYLPYDLPQIHDIHKLGNTIVTIEKRLFGKPLWSVFPSLMEGQQEQMMASYLAAVRALSEAPMPQSINRFKLFDSKGISERSKGDWNSFLNRYLKDKIIQVAPYLSRDVSNFIEKVIHIQEILAQPYLGNYRLIHGDFFPGNLLIDDRFQITALLDFGLMTMYGDELFDMATAWVLFDMYDTLKANIRERLLSAILLELGESIRGILYRYVIIYSILTANMYSSNCDDGHYDWCVGNLNNQRYWDNLE